MWTLKLLTENSFNWISQSHYIQKIKGGGFPYLLEQSHPVHSPLQVHTDLASTSTVQDPSFRQGLGEQGLTEKNLNFLSEYVVWW
jgi:hypothetical protein